MITPPPIRATVSAAYLFVVNMVAMGLGPLLTAQLNDQVFHSDLAVGKSVALVATSASVLAFALFRWGMPHFRAAEGEPRTS